MKELELAEPLIHKITQSLNVYNMEKKYNYKNLTVYKESKDLVLLVYKLLKKFPREEQYALCDQLRRAVISIPSNLAEGSGRTSSKDQAHFFEMAYGSLMEVSCQIDIAQELGYITVQEVDLIEQHVGTIAALLSGLRSKCLGTTTNSLNH